MGETKRGVRIHHVLVESLKGMENLQSDLEALADSTLPTRPDNWQELPFDHQPVNSHCDVIFKVRDRHFYCHKVKPSLFRLFCAFLGKLDITKKLKTRFFPLKLDFFSHETQFFNHFAQIL